MAPRRRAFWGPAAFWAAAAAHPGGGGSPNDEQPAAAVTTALVDLLHGHMTDPRQRGVCVQHVQQAGTETRHRMRQAAAVDSGSGGKERTCRLVAATIERRR